MQHESIVSRFDNALNSKQSDSNLLRTEDILPKGIDCRFAYKHNEYGCAAMSFLFRVDPSIKPEEMEAKLEKAHGLVNLRPDLKHEVADVRVGSGIFYRDDKFLVDGKLVSLYTKYCPKESFIAVGIYGHNKGWNSIAILRIRAVLEDLDKTIIPS